jgi:hypothetical protein
VLFNNFSLRGAVELVSARLLKTQYFTNLIQTFQHLVAEIENKGIFTNDSAIAQE